MFHYLGREYLGQYIILKKEIKCGGTILTMSGQIKENI
jgi:hypothetical protein